MLPVASDFDAKRGHPAPGNKPTKNLRRRVDRILLKVESAPVGTRNARLFWAACRFGEMISEGRLQPNIAEQLLRNAARSCGLIREDGPRAVGATIASGLRTGVRAA